MSSCFSSDSPTKVTGLKLEEGKIKWDNLTFNICKPKHIFKLRFKNGSSFLSNDTRTSTFFQCDLRCTKATTLDIWAVVDGLNWDITEFNLSKIDEGELFWKPFFVRLFFYSIKPPILCPKETKKCLLLRVVKFLSKIIVYWLKFSC